MKKILAMLIAAIMVLSLVACETAPAPAAEPAGAEAAPAAEEGKPIEIVFWTYFGDTNIGYINTCLDAFNASQTKYHATVEYQGSQAEMNAKMASTIQSELPAMFSGAVENTAMYAAADYCVPLQQFIDADPEGWPELEETWAAIRAAYSDGEGNQIGYPMGYSYGGLFYNKTMFDEAGIKAEDIQSMDDLYAACEKLVEGGYTKYGVGFHNDGFYFNGVLGREGLKAYNAGNGYEGKITECLYESDPTVNAAITNMLNVYQQLSAKNYMVPYGSDYQGDIIPLMADGECAMMLGVVSMTTKILKACSEKYEIGIVPMPSATEGGMRTGEPAGGTGNWIANNGNPEQMQGAYELIKFLSSADQAAYFATCTGYLAPNMQSYNSEVYQDYKTNTFPAISVVYDSLAASDDSANNPYIPISNEMKAANKQAIATVCEGGDVAEAIKVACETIQEAIEMYNLSNP